MGRRRLALLVAMLVGALAVSAAPAAGRMHSTLIRKHLCETTGGGKFVDIPGFPGEQIDRRLLPDIAWMVRRYDIFITDGYSLDPVHARNGEHPIGLAADIVPNAARGGTWAEIADLAHWAEPQQDHPRMPFRWVGWNGDPGHGRGNHLHLSWSHSETSYNTPARVVYTRICPEPRHRHRHRRGGDGSGGSGSGGTQAHGSDYGSGGISVPSKLSPAAKRALAPVVPEYGE